MATIKEVKARQILDSRDNPTVEVLLKIEEGTVTAAVPSGASTGKYEAVELRDGGKAYHGKGVQKAISNVNNIISPALIGKSLGQRQTDNILIKLDGTPNKRKLGANAILAVSMAVCRASALDKKIPLFQHISFLSKRKPVLPVPFMNIINGGLHAENGLDFQEYMIVPHGKTFAESYKTGLEVYRTLKQIIEEKYGKKATTLGDEGGFAPPLEKVEEPLKLIIHAIENSGNRGKVKLALDIAASELLSNGKYKVDGNSISSQDLSRLYKKLIKKYSIISIEDPFDQEDFESFSSLNKKIGNKVQIVGDDLLVTNPVRIKKAIKEMSCNTLLLKINQIGTITEVLDAAKLCFKNSWKVMVSHRSGETEDSFISDLAVGLGCGMIKAGAPATKERLSKYHRLLAIEKEMGGKK